MDDDVTYEIARVLYENIDAFREYYPSSLMTQQTIAAFPVPEDQFHPGAVKLYKEKGVTIGVK
jgi:TRAP-type uncharacterized transport system substrate-binding protein